MKRSVEIKNTTNLLMFYQQRRKPSSHVRSRQERSTSNLWSCAVRLPSAIYFRFSFVTPAFLYLKVPIVLARLRCNNISQSKTIYRCSEVCCKDML